MVGLSIVVVMRGRMEQMMHLRYPVSHLRCLSSEAVIF